MGILDKLKRNSAATRLAEESLYKSVLEELEDGYRRDGLWAKALADGKGDEAKAHGLYISYRVQSIRDEQELTKAQQEAQIESSISILKEKGFKVSARTPGWQVIEPLTGGKHQLDTMEALFRFTESYAQVRETTTGQDGFSKNFS